MASAAILFASCGCGDTLDRARDAGRDDAVAVEASVDGGGPADDLGLRDAARDSAADAESAEAGDASLDTDAPVDASLDSGPVCPDGLTPCARRDGYECVDLTCDYEHCGGCDAVCAVCLDGACGDCGDGTVPCGIGGESCGAAVRMGCRSLAYDPEHCGTCGHRCPEGWECQDGVCVDRGDAGSG